MSAVAGQHRPIGMRYSPPGAHVAPPLPLPLDNTTLIYSPTPTLALPAYLTPFTDPLWSTKVTRISDIAGPRNQYSKIQAWNSDQSQILLVDLASVVPGLLLDGTDYSVLSSSMPFLTTPVWSNTDPDVVFNCGASAGTFRSLNPNTLVNTVLHTFAGATNLRIGDSEGSPDDNDQYIGLMATIAGVETVLIYDIQNDVVVSTTTTSPRANNICVSHSGIYAILQYHISDTAPYNHAAKGAWLFHTSDLTTPIRQVFADKGQHFDFGWDTDGNEVVLYHEGLTYFRPVMQRLSDGVITALLPSGHSYASAKGHVSGRAIDLPGESFWSNYDTLSSDGYYLCDQVLRIRLDGSGDVEVFASAHHGADVYPKDPMASVSRDGLRMIFGSEWDASNVFCYVAEEY